MKRKIYECVIGLIIILSILTNLVYIGLADEYEEELGPGNAGDGEEIGGKGVVTCEPIENILRVERDKKNLIKDVGTIYTLSDPEFGIYTISVTGKNDENDVVLRTEFLNETTKCLKVSPLEIPMNVYKSVNLWIGSDDINRVNIKFAVANSWIENNGVSSQDVKVLQWNRNYKKWIELDINEENKDNTYTYFGFTTERPSQFIIGKYQEPSRSYHLTTPTITTAIPGTVPEDYIPLSKKGGATIIALLIIIASVIYYIAKKARNK